MVIGPSGSGKSTLCRTINRLETIESGSITIDGKPLPDEGKELAALRADVGMVFQSFNLFAHKTILENVTLGADQGPQDPGRRRREAGHWSCSSASGVAAAGAEASRRSSPAASSSAWRSPGRSRWTPR